MNEITDTPCTRASFAEKYHMVKLILSASFLSIISSLGYPIKEAISYYFLGRDVNSLQISAFGLGTMWVNLVGMAFCSGLVIGFGILISQASGANNPRKIGGLYQKICVVMVVFLSLVSPLLWYAEEILLACNVKPELAELVGSYVKIVTFGIIGWAIKEVNMAYLISFDRLDIPAKFTAFSCLIHFIICYVLVGVYQFQLQGIAISVVLSENLLGFGLLFYIKHYDPCPESKIPWSIRNLRTIRSFTKTILAQAFTVYAEWISIEGTVLIVLFLHNHDLLAAHCITINFLDFIAMITLGLNSSACFYIGQAAGEGCVYKSRKLTKVAACILLVLVSGLFFFILFGKHLLGKFYIGQHEISEVMDEILTVYQYGLLFDLGAQAFSFLLRTLEQDTFVLVSFIGCYLGIGLPVAYFLGVVENMEVQGVWIGMVCAYVGMFVLMVTRFLMLDWFKIVRFINIKMKEQSTLIDINDTRLGLWNNISHKTSMRYL